MSEPTAATAPAPSLQQQLGIPSDIHALGKVWKFGPPNQNAKAILEELYAVDAILENQKLSAHLPPEARQQMHRAFMARLDSGAYATGGEGWVSKLTNPACHPLFLLSLFRVNHPDLTRDEMMKIVEASQDEMEAALIRQVPGFFAEAFPGTTPEQRERLETMFREAIQRLRPSPSDSSPPNGTAL
jgi:hypothetical protein